MRNILNLCINPALDVHIELDSLSIGEEIHYQQGPMYLGGKGCNHARYALDLKHSIYNLYVLSKQDREYLTQLERKKMIPHESFWVEAAMRRNYNLHETSGRETILADQGFILTSTERLALETRVFEIIEEKSIDTVLLTGRLPAGIAASDFFSWPKTLHWIIDSKSFSLADFVEISPILIKPNRAEAQAMLQEAGQDSMRMSDEALALALHNQLPQTAILLSLGGEGLIYIDSELRLHFQGAELRPKSTVGAGDLLLAVFLAARNKGVSKYEALRVGLSTASCFCTYTGRDLPLSEAVQAYCESVVCNEF
ncbi:MAG: PfkB family carbohydrate kinase [Eubacteriales bacterium]|nr:PfkB family carbohydrate kinase [Eubacteriales bacterium]